MRTIKFLTTIVVLVSITQTSIFSQTANAEENKPTNSEIDISALESIPSRSEYQNAMMLSIGNESLVVGAEYLRFLKLGSDLLPYMSLGFGIGTWIEGPSLWSSGRFYFWGKNNWAPFLGVSVTLWNGTLAKADDNTIKTTLQALGVYAPIGVQYFGENGLLLSFEAAAYSAITASWQVKEVEQKPETTITGFQGEALKLKGWFGVKIGFGF